MSRSENRAKGMTLRMKYFTVEEANASLPQITAALSAALDTKIRIEMKVDEWRKAHGTASEADEAVYRGQVDFLAARLEEQLGGITDLGAIPKDLDMGLIDFPARVGEKEAYLCWKVGEDRVAHWHGLTDGYGGRKPLETEKHEKKRK